MLPLYAGASTERPLLTRFFNEIAQPNTPRVVLFPKNSYQAFFARDELEHADRRIHEFVRQVHSQFIGNAQVFP